MNHYDVLKVAGNASAAQIKAAYRKLASQYHPDRATSPSDAALRHSLMQELNEAYAVLSDPQRRAHYDDLGFARTAAKKSTGKDKGGAENTQSQGPHTQDFWERVNAFKKTRKAADPAKARPKKPKPEAPKEPQPEQKSESIKRQFDYDRLIAEHYCPACYGSGSRPVMRGYHSVSSKKDQGRTKCIPCDGDGIAPKFKNLYEKPA